MKNVVLIRHGQSLGQTCYENGMDRDDEALTDCFLSKRGVSEAAQLRFDETLLSYNFDLVCTSPLTRAVATCVLALGHITDREIEQSADGVPTTPFIALADIAEMGKSIPENTGRKIKSVKKDLKNKLSTNSVCEWICGSGKAAACLDRIDFSLLPSSWPVVRECSRKEKRRKLQIFLKWLMEREEKKIAIVCHYHIIRLLLRNAVNYIPNCVPVECVLLDMDGAARLVLKSDYEKDYGDGDVQMKEA